MIWIILFLAAGLLFLAGKAYERLWRQGIEATVAVEEPYVYAGEKAHFTEIIANRGKIPLPEIEVRFRLPQGPVFENSENVIISDHLYKRDVFALRPREQITRHYIVQCPKRGLYPVSDLTVKAISFFHHKEYEIGQKTNTRLTVYAAWTNVSGILAHCDAILGDLESRRKTIEDPFAWASIRSYTPQDPLRSVNWKASARTGELMVNTYASVQAMQYCIFLDTMDERIVKQEDLVELGISAAASLSRKLVKRGQEAGLYIYSDIPVEQLPPSRGQAQLTKIEQMLTADYTKALEQKAGQSAGRENRRSGEDADRADRRSYAKWSFETAGAVPSDSICVFISKEEESLEELERLLRAPGTGGGKRNSIPAVLVQPSNENGRDELKSRIIYG